MGMILVSKKLLENEIKEKKGNELYQSYVAKELDVIKKLDIAFCDMAGTPEDLAKRLDGCEVIIMPRGTYRNLQSAAAFRNAVKFLLQEGADEQSRTAETCES